MREHGSIIICCSQKVLLPCQPCVKLAILAFGKKILKKKKKKE